MKRRTGSRHERHKRKGPEQKKRNERRRKGHLEDRQERKSRVTVAVLGAKEQQGSS